MKKECFCLGESCRNDADRLGFTLMELMVYIAIVGIVVLIAGQAFSHSTRMRVRTESMLKASEVAEKTGVLLKEDISRMGAKSSMESTSGINESDAFTVQPSVYISTTDSSSYVLSPGTQYDNLLFRRISYSEQGKFQRVEEINWFVDGSTLKRSCRTVNGFAAEDCPAGNNPTPVEVATGVDSFKVYQALPQNDSGLVRLFPKNALNPDSKAFRLISYYGTDDFARTAVNPEEGAGSVTLSSFTSNYSADLPSPSGNIVHTVLVADSGSTDEDWKLCKSFNFRSDLTIYEISFGVGNNSNASRMIIPGKDHFSVGLRIPGSTPEKIAGLDDFLVYMPQNEKGVVERHLRFSLPRAAGAASNTVDACVAFTFAFYSPFASAAEVSITNVQVNEITEMSYTIPEDAVLDVSYKKMVKAFEVNLIIKKNGESGKSSLIIPVPSNGVKG